MRNILDEVNSKYFDEVFDRVQKEAIKKERKLTERLKHYKKMQEKHIFLTKKGYKISTLGGGYESNIKNTQYWLDKHIEKNIELLI